MTHEVKLSSADRVLFPDDGITKGDLFDYYGEIAPAIVPHLRDRPFTMKRWREGLPGGSFFQKQAPKGIPDWIPTRQFRTWPREGGSRLVDFPLVNSREALLWMVQMHCIDMNAWYSRVDKPDRPDFVLFDLDPPDDPGGFPLAIRVAHLIRAALDELDLASYVKTSGADGIHVLVPIARRHGYDETYEFAELLSRRLEAEHPGEVTTEWLKKKREGVLVDHRQNGHGKTIASVYSVRPKPGAPVSTPLRWEELTEDDPPARLLDGGRARARRAARRPVRAGAARRPDARAGAARAPPRARRRAQSRGGCPAACGAPSSSSRSGSIPPRCPPTNSSASSSSADSLTCSRSSALCLLPLGLALGRRLAAVAEHAVPPIPERHRADRNAADARLSSRQPSGQNRGSFRRPRRRAPWPRTCSASTTRPRAGRP